MEKQRAIKSKMIAANYQQIDNERTAVRFMLDTIQQNPQTTTLVRTAKFTVPHKTIADLHACRIELRKYDGKKPHSTSWIAGNCNAWNTKPTRGRCRVRYDQLSYTDRTPRLTLDQFTIPSAPLQAHQSPNKTLPGRGGHACQPR